MSWALYLHCTDPTSLECRHAAMGEEMKVRAATVTALDAAVGEIVAAVRGEGMLDNTLILFSSDNGGAGNRFNK